MSHGVMVAAPNGPSPMTLLRLYVYACMCPATCGIPLPRCNVKLCSVVGSIPASLTYAVTHGNILLLLSL